VNVCVFLFCKAGEGEEVGETGEEGGEGGWMV